MQESLSFLFPLALIALSAVLLALHIKKRRALGHRSADAELDVFHRRQLRRRIQVSAMIGLLGIAIAAGMLIPWQRSPLGFAFYWFVVIVCTLWIAVLALADLTHSRSYISHLDREHRIKRAELEAQLQRYKAKQSNGQKEK